MAGMRAVDPRVSFAELSEWPDDGRRYELYDGEVVVVPSPNLRHQRILVVLVGLLQEYERRSGGAVVIAPFDIVLSDYDVLQPDLVFFGAEKRSRLNPLSAAHVVPDLAIEVLSRSTEVGDRGRKLQLLAQHGLPEYWVVDPAVRTLEIYTRSGLELVLVSSCEGNQEIVSPTLSGLRFQLDLLFVG